MDDGRRTMGWCGEGGERGALPDRAGDCLLAGLTRSTALSKQPSSLERSRVSGGPVMWPAPGWVRSTRSRERSRRGIWRPRAEGSGGAAVDQGLLGRWGGDGDGGGTLGKASYGTFSDSADVIKMAAVLSERGAQRNQSSVLSVSLLQHLQKLHRCEDGNVSYSFQGQ